MPLFDHPEDVPWAFPVPKECEAARFELIAAEPNVLGLTIAIIKHIHDELKVKTLGQLQKALKADEKMKTEDQDKAKIALGKRLGPNTAVRLLRAIASFTGQRKRKLPPPRDGKKPDKKETTPEHPINRRLLPVKELVSETETKQLAKADIKTVSDFQTFVDECLSKQSKDKPNPHFVRDCLVSALSVPTEAAQRIMDKITSYISKEVEQSKKK